MPSLPDLRASFSQAPFPQASFRLAGARPWRAALAALLTALAIGPWSARAADRALLVGVTQYEEKAIRALEGPNNDVVLMWRELRRRGVATDNISVLAEGLPSRDDVPVPKAPPTRAAILEALAQLAALAAAGDFVVFQFSGHGATQPVSDPTAQLEPEPDGRDQVLLPRDAGMYDPRQQSIRNAIVDDDLARALDAIRAKGATVWAVIDACHSGTVTRSTGDAVARTVRASALGVPSGPGAMPAAPQPVRRAGTLGPRPSPQQAPLIGFYAVDSRSEAIERIFAGFRPGLVGPPGQERVGVFTAQLINALAAGKARTFRDLARGVAANLSRLQGAASVPMPVFDGDLDRVIGGGDAVPALRFEAKSDGQALAIAAGALHGLDVGARVAVFDGPLADARRLGAMKIAEVTASTSVAVGGGMPAREDLWIEVEEAAASFTFRLARPRLPEGGDGERLERIVTRAKEGSGRNTLAVEIVAPQETADLHLVVDGGRLWLVPDGQVLNTDPGRPGTTVSLDLAAADTVLAGQLRRIVWSMARASNLVRLASVGGDDGASPLAVTVDLVRETDPLRLADEQRPCAPPARAAKPARLTPGVPIAAGHCDMFAIGLQNTGDRDLDVAVFYLDSRAGVALVDERMANNGCVVTLPAAMDAPLALPPRQFALWEDGKPLAVGLQRLLIFAGPRAGSTPPALCHLREPSIETSARSAARKEAPARGFAGLLAEVGLANGAVRSATLSAAGDDEPGRDVVTRQFTFDLRARPI